VEKTLVIGCGFLGSHIFTHLQNKNEQVKGTNFEKGTKKFIKLDVNNFDTVNELIIKENPDLVVNCAAITNIDQLEKNQNWVKTVNGNGVGNIAKACNQNSSRLIHISTDSVFDGKQGCYNEDDKPNPINNYSKSKLIGEDLVQKYSKNFVIVRTNMFGYNHEGKFLFNWIVKNLENKKKIVGFDDVIFNPIEINTLSEFIIELGDLEFVGILHVSADEIISKFEFSCKIADIFNFDKNLIQRGSSDNTKFIAKRPKNTSLSNLKAKELFKKEFPSLREEIIKIKKTIGY
jgi:dTDP-4-dehydrorhamnose reductase